MSPESVLVIWLVKYPKKHSFSRFDFSKKNLQKIFFHHSFPDQFIIFYQYFKGTIPYMPLDIIRQIQDGEEEIRNYSAEKCDIYALGICALQLLRPDIMLKTL